MQKTVSQWVALFNEGNPLLLQLIVENNPNAVGNNLRALGLPVPSNPDELYKEICNAAPMMTKEAFFSLLNVRFITENNPDFYEVLATARNEWDGTGKQINSYTFGQVFPAGIEKLYSNILEAKRQNAEFKPEQPTPTSTSEALLAQYINERKAKDRTNERKAIAFILFGIALSLTFFTVQHIRTLR